jgi:hypothetical protein
MCEVLMVSMRWLMKGRFLHPPAPATGALRTRASADYYCSPHQTSRADCAVNRREIRAGKHCTIHGSAVHKVMTSHCTNIGLIRRWENQDDYRNAHNLMGFHTEDAHSLRTLPGHAVPRLQEGYYPAHSQRDMRAVYLYSRADNTQDGRQQFWLMRAHSIVQRVDIV